MDVKPFEWAKKTFCGIHASDPVFLRGSIFVFFFFLISLVGLRIYSHRICQYFFQTAAKRSIEKLQKSHILLL